MGAGRARCLFSGVVSRPERQQYLGNLMNCRHHTSPVAYTLVVSEIRRPPGAHPTLKTKMPEENCRWTALGCQGRRVRGCARGPGSGDEDVRLGGSIVNETKGKPLQR